MNHAVDCDFTDDLHNHTNVLDDILSCSVIKYVFLVLKNDVVLLLYKISSGGMNKSLAW